jgi:hypothetical protein
MSCARVRAPSGACSWRKRAVELTVDDEADGKEQGRQIGLPAAGKTVGYDGAEDTGSSSK